MGSCQEPVENWFFVCYSLVGPNWWLELGVLEAYPSGGSFKSWGARLWVQALHSSGKSWKLGVSFQLYGTVPGVGFMAKVYCSLSYPFWCGIFLIHSMCKSHSACSWICFQGNCSMCNCRFSVSVCLNSGEFRSLICCHLGLEPSAQGASFLRQSPSASQSESTNKLSSPLQLRQKPPLF